jgi:hypothetical protein
VGATHAWCAAVGDYARHRAAASSSQLARDARPSAVVHADRVMQDSAVHPDAAEMRNGLLGCMYACAMQRTLQVHEGMHVLPYECDV